MIKDLKNTTAGEIAATLVDARRETGSPIMGAVLTLVVATEEKDHYDAMDAAVDAAHEHPSRILIVIRRPEKSFTQLNAQVRVGDNTGPGETVVLRLHGELADHADAVVLPLLLPDVPVVTWWPGDGPDQPHRHPLGVFAQRRITDAAACPSPAERLVAQSRGYAPGDTDLAWTRVTPWRSLLAAALDQYPAPITGCVVAAEKDNPSAELLSVWLGSRLGVPVRREIDEGPGITGVRMMTADGPVSITRPDGALASLSVPGQPDRPVALKRRELPDLIAEELRRLDPDQVYASVLARIGSGEQPAGVVTAASAATPTAPPAPAWTPAPVADDEPPTRSATEPDANADADPDAGDDTGTGTGTELAGGAS